MKTLTTRVFSAILALGLPLVAHAQVDIIGTLTNVDVFNRTGRPVNDFKITIVGGIPPNTGFIRDTFNNPTYGFGQVMQTPDTVMITWGPGPFTQPGQLQHFGVGYFGNPIRPSTICYDWTIDGVPVPNPGDPNRPQQVWDPVGRRVVDIIRNTTWRVPRPIWVRRFGLVLPREVMLDELVRDSPIFDAAFIIDDTPVLLPPDQDLIFDSAVFEYNGAGEPASFIIGYSSWEDAGGVPGEEIGDTFNAAVVPAPGVITVGLLAFAVILRRRR